MTNKAHIPKAIREQCWLQNFGKVYEHRCYVRWCHNQINVFDFHVGLNYDRSDRSRVRLPVGSGFDRVFSDNISDNTDNLPFLLDEYMCNLHVKGSS